MKVRPVVRKRFSDHIPTDDWDDRQIAMWAADQVINHEELCAQRWGTLVKLTWAVLGGVGLILADVIKDEISYILDFVHRAH